MESLARDNGGQRWLGMSASLVAVMMILTFAQTSLTSYEARKSMSQAQIEVIRLTRSDASALPSPPLRALQEPAPLSPVEVVPPVVPPAPPVREDQAEIVKELLEMANGDTAAPRKKYRSLVCTLTRNDQHLREYVVRNLLAGFSAIVIYDNNQVRGCEGSGLESESVWASEPKPVTTSCTCLVPEVILIQHLR